MIHKTYSSTYLDLSTAEARPGLFGATLNQPGLAGVPTLSVTIYHENMSGNTGLRMTVKQAQLLINAITKALEGGPVDMQSSVSRQHYIDTGHYLTEGGACLCDPPMTTAEATEGLDAFRAVLDATANGAPTDHPYLSAKELESTDYRFWVDAYGAAFVSVPSGELDLAREAMRWGLQERQGAPVRTACWFDLIEWKQAPEKGRDTYREGV